MRYVPVLQDYTTCMMSENLDYKMFKMRYSNGLYVCQILLLFKMVTLQKIRKTRDASHK